MCTSPDFKRLSAWFSIFLKLIYFNWRLINLSYCFCHTLTWVIDFPTRQKWKRFLGSSNLKIRLRFLYLQICVLFVSPAPPPPPIDQFYGCLCGDGHQKALAVFPLVTEDIFLSGFLPGDSQSWRVKQGGYRRRPSQRHRFLPFRRLPHISITPFWWKSLSDFIKHQVTPFLWDPWEVYWIVK